MLKFNKINPDALEQLQVEAGVLLNSFNPSTPTAPADEAIICATTGGIKADCVPEMEDFGSDIDNVPENTKELKRITGWSCTFAFTALNVTTEIIKTALGAADVTGNKITPRAEIEANDFEDIWWVGDLTGGGMLAINLKNALSTGGLSLQTTKKGKGQLAVTLVGHISIQNVETIPMEFYISNGTSNGGGSST